MKPGHLLHSTPNSPWVQELGNSQRDTHLYPLHNNSSVFLTTTTYVQHSGRNINGTRSGRTAPQDSALQFQTTVHTHPNDLPKKSLGPAQPPPHRWRMFPLLPVLIGNGLLCGLWVWHRTNRRPCRPPMSNRSTPSRPTRPDGSGRWDNRMASQHLTRYLGGLAVDKRRTRSNEKRSRRSIAKLRQIRSCCNWKWFKSLVQLYKCFHILGYSQKYSHNARASSKK